MSIVAALADNGVIGRGGELPWHLPDDLKRFKSLTMGKPILMGRRTFESIGRALSGRRNLVLTRHAKPLPAGVEAVASVAEARQCCADVEELCVIGGAEVFALTLADATRLELTRVHAMIDGDVYFPNYDPLQWREVARLEHAADDRHAWSMSFLSLERVCASGSPRR